MKFNKPKNSGYVATVIKLKNILPLENCDNLVGTTIFGFQGIVPKSYKVGDTGIVFPAETQLSDEYCIQNNLYRHNELNKDKTEKGYIEDSRRIKAVKFRGNRSDCLFMPLQSLTWAGVKESDFKEGDEFDTINDKPICEKYVIKTFTRENRLNGQKKKFKRVEAKFMPEHVETDNFFKWSPTLDPETNIIVSQKLHGTSVRIANTIVKRKLSLLEKLLYKLGVHIQLNEMDYVYGSRKVIKDANNPDQKHYYDEDLWSNQGKQLIGLIPENYIIFGELIGWTSTGAPIQKDYTYGIPEKTAHLYVYRIAIVNGQGILQDLSFDHMVEFCKEVGLRYVAEIWRGKLKDFKVEEWLDKRFFDDMGLKQCVWLGDNKGIPDEGVVIRVDKKMPYFLKAKGSRFLKHETDLLDQQVIDIESTQSEEIVDIPL